MSKKMESNPNNTTTKPTVVEDEYINTGLQKWEEIRSNWIKVDPSKCTKQKGEVRAKNIDVDDVIERIYSQSGNGALREPIPLGQMIDLLIDFWEADGLYD